ncbi:MAG: ATP-binding protein [Bacteroidota bacterium]|nr:ATP-binding protein [Bacteroidota bacterium]
MELLVLSFLVCGSLFGIAFYIVRQRYVHQAATEQDRANDLSISESQLKQKNSLLASELDETKKKLTSITTAADQLSQDLTLHSSKEKEAQEQLQKTKELISMTTAQLHATLEERTAELQRMQQLLHDESGARKRVEEILADKELSADHTTAELHATISKLKHEVASLTEQVQNETSSRKLTEQTKYSTETELQKAVTLLESQLSALQAEFQKTSEELQEEHTGRLATEHALQESKEKLYAHIHELEQKLHERDQAAGELHEALTSAENKNKNLEQAVYGIIAHSPIPVLVVNEHGVCEFLNTGMTNFLGFASDDLLGKHFSKLFPQQDRSFYEEQWNSASNRAEEFKGETRIMTSTGDTISVEMSFTEINTGCEKKFVGFIFDKTHELESQKHYATAKQREEELLHLKSRFITMVTHHLRTALVTVATNAELLERFVLKWNEQKRYHAFFRINETLKQMMDLLRNVESATGATIETNTQNITTVNLETLVQNVAKEAMTDAQTDHHVILSEQGNINAIAVNEQMVKTILYHVLSNAFKYSSNKSDVKIHIDRVDSKFTLTIADQGAGIPADEQKYLFTSFFRGSNVGNVQGTGLGLTIVQQYVQAAHGTVSIKSEKDTGTTVTVTLPILST